MNNEDRRDLADLVAMVPHLVGWGTMGQEVHLFCDPLPDHDQRARLLALVHAADPGREPVFHHLAPPDPGPWLPPALPARAGARGCPDTRGWGLLQNLEVRSDPRGLLEALRKQGQVPYPNELRDLIVGVHLPRLSDGPGGLAAEAQRAWERDDVVRLYHILAQYLHSLMEVLYAVNALPLPGSNDLLARATARCPHMPEDLVRRVQDLLLAAAQVPDGSSRARAIMEGLNQDMRALSGLPRA